MPSPSFPKECLDNILLFLDNSTIYNCLFTNRYLCRLCVPIIWRDPFDRKSGVSLISTLLSCHNEEEELIFHPIIYNNQTPIFEYEKFIKIIRHDDCVNNIKNWLGSLINSSNSSNKITRRKKSNKGNTIKEKKNSALMLYII
jgi:hypothetical protein